MKPIHEELWRHNGGDRVLTEPERYIRAAAYGAGNLTADTKAAARFIAAAPDMARALLAHGYFEAELNGAGQAWHIIDCWNTGRGTCLPECQRDRDALVKAGVL